MDKWVEIEKRRQAGRMTRQDAFDVLRRHLDDDPGDGQADEYEAVDVLWSAGAEVESLRAADDDRRRAACKALAIPRDTDWDGVLAAARNAGIVRDAEYRWGRDRDRL